MLQYLSLDPVQEVLLDLSVRLGKFQDLLVGEFVVGNLTDVHHPAGAALHTQNMRKKRKCLVSLDICPRGRTTVKLQFRCCIKILSINIEDLKPGPNGKPTSSSSQEGDAFVTKNQMRGRLLQVCYGAEGSCDSPGWWGN